ncbi:MAG: HAD family hydrolase [Pseudomonadota bacterium]
MTRAILIFDLDGTLVESAAAIRDVANALFATLDLAPLSLAETRSFIGKGARHFVERALRHREAFDAATIEQHHEHFQTLYRAAPGSANAAFPGADACLRHLQAEGHTLALCTNKPEAPTRAVLDAHAWTGLFTALVCGDSGLALKPSPTPLRQAADLARQATNAPAETPCVFIGDSEVDAETAAAAGIAFVLYTEGYRHTPVDAIRAAATVSAFADLPRSITALLQR